jgi:hypothetical protein
MTKNIGFKLGLSLVTFVACLLLLEFGLRGYEFYQAKVKAANAPKDVPSSENMVYMTMPPPWSSPAMPLHVLVGFADSIRIEPETP